MSLRKPPSGRLITCPFCNKRDFGVKYAPPLTLIEAQEQQQLTGNTENVANVSVSSLSHPETMVNVETVMRVAKTVKCEAIQKPLPIQNPYAQSRPRHHHHGSSSNRHHRYHHHYANHYRSSNQYPGATSGTSSRGHHNRHYSQEHGRPVNRFVPYTGPPFTVRNNGRVTRYGPGTMVMYNEYGTPIYLPPGAGDAYSTSTGAMRYLDYSQDNSF